MKIYNRYRSEGNTLIDEGGMFGQVALLRAEWPDMAIIDPAALPADFSVDTYTISDGQLVKASTEVIAKRQAAKQAETNQAEIEQLRAYLTSTDYAAIKCGELGLSMAAEYPGLHARRTEARARINALQEGGAE